MSRATPEPARGSLPWRQRLWPTAPALLVAAAVGALLTYTYDAKTGKLLVAVMLPLVLAIIVTAVAIGGRRGVLAGVGLTALLVYWAWFGWRLEYDGGFSPNEATRGVAEVSIYQVGLFVLLWPVVLAVALIVGVVARRRGARIWPALGLAALGFVALSLPVRGSWDDTCNGLHGATPAATAMATQPLMDAGIGVIPVGTQTSMYCPQVADKTWKPFWLGGDGLPPKPHLNTWQGGTIAAGIQIPERLDDSPASGSAADGARRR